METILLISC